jgi:calmodulin
MNIHSQEYEDIDDKLLYHFNEQFEKYSKKGFISFDNLMKVVREFGYNPTVYETNDLKGEIGEQTDKIYFFVIMKRVVNQFSTNEQKENLKEAFKIINKSGSGYISKDELIEYMIRNNLGTINSIDEIFTDLDTNLDDYISFEEFQNYIKVK